MIWICSLSCSLWFQKVVLKAPYEKTEEVATDCKVAPEKRLPPAGNVRDLLYHFELPPVLLLWPPNMYLAGSPCGPTWHTALTALPPPHPRTDCCLPSVHPKGWQIHQAKQNTGTGQKDKDEGGEDWLWDYTYRDQARWLHAAGVDVKQCCSKILKKC